MFCSQGPAKVPQKRMDKDSRTREFASGVEAGAHSKTVYEDSSCQDFEKKRSEAAERVNGLQEYDYLHVADLNC